MGNSSDIYTLGLMLTVTVNQHEPSATLMKNGCIVACCEEERYVRTKHAYGQLPVEAVGAALKIGGITIKDVKGVYISADQHGDLFERTRLFLEHYFGYSPPIYGVNHQLAHMASTYYMSGFPEAMVISYDGFGDFRSMAMGVGKGSSLEILETKDYKQSIGLFYQILTQFIGFHSAGDEYKVMGLSAYGKPGIDLSPIIQVSGDDFAIDYSFFEREPPARSLAEPRYGSKLVDILGAPRHKGEKLTQRHMDIAYAVQNNFERAIITIVRKLHERTGLRKLCLAGGCALNCVVNMKLRGLPFIDDLFIQPAAGDQGTGLGSALIGVVKNGITPIPTPTYYLGSEYTEAQMEDALKLVGMPYNRVGDRGPSLAAEAISKGRIIGVFRGRSEFGPRALGNRSILANAALPDIKDQINSRIKFREEFRPFAPAVLAEEASNVFEMDGESSFMTCTFPVRREWQARLPGITHVDGTARVQTVSQSDNAFFYALLKDFNKRTGVPLVLNTSFNVMGDPIVERPLEAIRTFYGCGIDELYLGPFHLQK